MDVESLHVYYYLYSFGFKGIKINNNRMGVLYVGEGCLSDY